MENKYGTLEEAGFLIIAKDKIQELKRLVKEKQEAEYNNNIISQNEWFDSDDKEGDYIFNLSTIEKNTLFIDKLILEL